MMWIICNRPPSGDCWQHATAAAGDPMRKPRKRIEHVLAFSALVLTFAGAWFPIGESARTASPPSGAALTMSPLQLAPPSSPDEADDARYSLCWPDSETAQCTAEPPAESSAS